jgi:hypothetical protein
MLLTSSTLGAGASNYQTAVNCNKNTFSGPETPGR